MNKELVGTVAVDGGEIAIVDPSHLKNTELVAGDLLKIETAIVAGRYPIYFEKDDEEGGYGKSRIIIELGGMDIKEKEAL